MSLKALEQLGAFVSDAPVQKEISFQLDTEETLTTTIYVRRLGVGEYERLYTNKDEKHGISARIIAEAITLGDGGERIPVEKAFRLHKGIANAMLEAFKEVNRGKKG